MTSPVRISRHRALTWPLAVVAGAAIVLAGCGSSSKTATTSPPTSAGTPTTTGSAPTSTGSGSTSAAQYTISATSVPGVGTVLVNGNGRTLYLLTSEKAGGTTKLTCNDANGCTQVWPPTQLPTGVTHAVAGSGVQASLLGTTPTSAGKLYVTYNGWPVYMFSGDSGPGMVNGKGINSFGGSWWPISTAGDKVMSSSGSTSPSSGGYSY